jgi:ATP-binding cassette subfamily B protein
MTQNFRALFKRVGAFNARLEENVGGMRVVQAFANEEHERRLFAQDNGLYRDTKLRAYRLMAASTALSYLGMRLIQVVIMVAGTWLVIHGDLTQGGFISFLLLITVFFRPIEKINAVMEVYPKGIAGFRSYLELLSTEPDIAERPDAVALAGFSREIRYEQVSFGYDTTKTVLRDIDLSIRAGETVAFVGPSGAGKTTICSLLPRFYEPSAGRITIDGVDLRELDGGVLRRRIGLVQQEDFLFSGTIRDNLSLGRDGITEAGLARALEITRAVAVVDRLADGLDSEVAERGVTLSTGERELLAIARAVAGDPGLVILDEATSSVDSQTEAQIEEATHNLLRGRSALVVAHRLSTVRRADRILVFHKGRLRESGTHEELLAAGGVYAKLHALQFHDADDSVQAGHP